MATSTETSSAGAGSASLGPEIMRLAVVTTSPISIHTLVGRIAGYVTNVYGELEVHHSASVDNRTFALSYREKPKDAKSGGETTVYEAAYPGADAERKSVIINLTLQAFAAEKTDFKVLEVQSFV